MARLVTSEEMAQGSRASKRKTVRLGTRFSLGFPFPIERLFRPRSTSPDGPPAASRELRPVRVVDSLSAFPSLRTLLFSSPLP
ncbi:unnamed protein product [Sphagnum tenellum]